MSFVGESDVVLLQWLKGSGLPETLSHRQEQFLETCWCIALVWSEVETDASVVGLKCFVNLICPSPGVAEDTNILFSLSLLYQEER